MHFVPKAALAAVIALSASTVLTTAPLEAQKKGKQAEQSAPPEMSEAFRVPALAADQAIDANDLTTARSQLATATAAATNDKERYFVDRISLKLSDKAKDAALMQRALDGLIANSTTPPEELKTYVMSRAEVALNAKKPAEALPLLRKAQSLGSTDPNLSLRLVTAMVDSGDVKGGVAELDKAIAAKKAAGQPAPAEWYLYAAGKLQNANDTAGTIDWMERLVRAYPTPQNWLQALSFYRSTAPVLKGDPKDQTVRAGTIGVSRLMQVTGALPDQNGYLNYALDASNAGLKYEAISVIEQGRASGKIPAGSKDAAEIEKGAKTAAGRDASPAGLEKEALAKKDGGLATYAGNAYLGQGNAAKAAELFQAALTYPKVDKVSTMLHLGIAQTKAGDTAGARQTFAGLQGTPLADLAKFWTVYLDTKSGTATTGA